MERREAGASAEALARRYLEERGLKLLERNFRCRGGEIDLIMRDGSCIALIEVRLRSDDRYGGAAASVNWKKQQRLIVAARYLLLTRPPLRGFPLRFDVVTLEPAHGDLRVAWLKDAFRIDGDRLR